MVNFDKEKLYASLLLSSEVVQYLVTVQKSEFKEEIGLGVSCACGVLRIATFVGFFFLKSRYHSYYSIEERGEGTPDKTQAQTRRETQRRPVCPPPTWR